jgi:hypothetical protein
MKRLPSLLVLVALALSGCSARTTTSAAPSPGAPGGSARPSAPAVSSTAGSGPPAATGSHSGAPASSAATPASKAGAQDHSLPLTVTLNKTCAHPGDTMIAKATTVPHATMAFVASYAKRTTPDYTWVPDDANASGSFTWTWILRPDVPKGAAQLKVVAGLASENRGATDTKPFVVALTC